MTRPLRLVYVGPDGTLYISDSQGGHIRRVDLDGRMTTVPRPGFSLSFPRGVRVGPEGSLYIGNQGAKNILQARPDGTMVKVVGSNGILVGGDGDPATQVDVRANVAFLNQQGDLVIGDLLSDSIRRVDTNGIISTIAGTGITGFNGDGGPPTQTQLDHPVYIADRKRGQIFTYDLDSS